MKRQCSEWEKIFTSEVRGKRLISKIYKLNIKKKKPNQKMGRRLKQIFLQRRRTDGQQTHEKVLSIVHYERNADRNSILFKTLI